MALAIFDLDNTLLAGDSDHLWGRFLIDRGVVDGTVHARENERFLKAYENGELDIHEFLAFALAPLAGNRIEDLERWREAFVEEVIRPIMLPAARALVRQHHAAGDTLMIITATNRFVTEPIARLYGIPHLLATEPERDANGYTGRPRGVPTFREGKVRALEQWRAEHRQDAGDTHFYSDSRNDLPLLERVSHPVAVDPDPVLSAEARRRAWPRLTLRAGPRPQPIHD